MMRRRSHTRAFTLLEMILVMVIICTALAMVAPSMRGLWLSSETNNAAEQIVAVLRWARSQAIVEGNVYRFNVDAPARTYWLTRLDQADFVELGTEFGHIFAVPEDMQISMTRLDQDAAPCIEFYPDGKADLATVQLTDRQGWRVEIGCLSPTELYRVLASEEGRR